jgi:asparagine synthase (glutamine-hydrolysing)
MCGILGRLSFHQRVGIIDVSLLAHRGPDASAEWLSPDLSCRLGHTRLAIQDITMAGAQPMTSRDGKYTIIFNGEIYNHLPLRTKLPGFEWRGHADTETLLELWAQYGSASLEWIRGMFAFAIHDGVKDTITLVRDRLGIKPLYYRLDEEGLIFASELRAIAEGNPVNWDEGTISTYLALGHLPGSGVIADGIRQLAPGHSLQITRSGGCDEREWWSLLQSSGSCKVNRTPNRDEAMHEIRALVEDSVQEHLIADVPVASFLSGGIDSSIISILASRHLPQRLKTFCVGFPGKSGDERAIARVVSQSCSSEHHEIVLTDQECLEWTREAVRAMDVPSADAINTYIVSKAVRREGVKVALSGLGGDELFGGYPSFHEVRLVRNFYAIPSGLRNGLLRFLPRKIGQKLSGLETWSAYRFALHRRSWMTASELKDIGVTSAPRWPQVSEPGCSAREDDFQMVTRAEIEGYMQPMLLLDSDQMSMSLALELRVPFLDHRLVEYVYGLPMNLKRGRLPKQLLIDTFRDLLPEQVWNRSKQGFVLPMDRWMRGPLADLVEEGLQSVKTVVSPDFVRKRREDFARGQIHWTRLWQLVVLGLVMKKDDLE